MLTLLTLVSLFHAPASFGAHAPFTLTCHAIHRTCDQDGTVQGERYTIEEKIPDEYYATEGRVTTKDGRFTIRGLAIIEQGADAKPKSAVQVYDSQKQSGAAGGTLALGTPASPHSELVYVYDAKNDDDGDGLFCHAIEASCDLK